MKGCRISGIAISLAVVLLLVPVRAPFAAETSCQVATFGGQGVDLDAWPFGVREVLIESRLTKSRSMALLRQVVEEDVPVPTKWRRHLARVRNESLSLQLAVVNDLVNRVPYKRLVDWVHPTVFLKSGGDCDCAAVTKYMLLRKLGVPARDLRVVLVDWPLRRARHAILLVRGGPDRLQRFVLDITTDRVVAAAYCEQYVPLMSVNERGVWRHAKTPPGVTAHFLNPRIVPRAE